MFCCCVVISLQHNGTISLQSFQILETNSSAVPDSIAYKMNCQAIYSHAVLKPVHQPQSMFPGEKVHHNAICFNCSKDCGNFKHEWLHKKELAFCPETKIWWLVFVEGKGKFCLLCRKHDCHNPQNKSAVFSKTPAMWYRPATLKEHIGTPLSSHSHPGKTKQHQDAIYWEMLQRTSFFQMRLDEERL